MLHKSSGHVFYAWNALYIFGIYFSGTELSRKTFCIFFFSLPRDSFPIQFIKHELFMALSTLLLVSYTTKLILVFTEDTFHWITCLGNPNTQIMTAPRTPYCPNTLILYCFSKFQLFLSLLFFACWPHSS